MNLFIFSVLSFLIVIEFINYCIINIVFVSLVQAYGVELSESLMEITLFLLDLYLALKYYNRWENLISKSIFNRR